jgi:phosphoglucosamine mutase
MAKLVRENGAHVGVALDGDADRVIMCDENGEIVDGDAILAICAYHLHGKGSLAKDTVVGTKMSNMGLEVALAKKNIKLLRTDVGDRYVMEVMLREKLNLGGETSGHIIFLHHTTSGDGTLAALRVLSVMLQQAKPLSEVRKVYTAYPQVTVNVRVREKRPIEKLPKVQAAMADAESKLGGKGRLLVRYSGTEKIARVMVEGEDIGKIKHIADHIAHAFESELN